MVFLLKLILPQGTEYLPSLPYLSTLVFKVHANCLVANSTFQTHNPSLLWYIRSTSNVLSSVLRSYKSTTIQHK